MNARAQRDKRLPTVNLNPLEVTFTAFAATIANKGLTRIANPLNATLTKEDGGPLDTSRRISIHLVGPRHASAMPQGLAMRLRFSPVTSHESLVTNHESPVTSHQSRVTHP